MFSGPQRFETRLFSGNRDGRQRLTVDKMVGIDGEEPYVNVVCHYSKVRDRASRGRLCQSEGVPTPRRALTLTPIELIQTASPVIGGIGGAFYFDPATLARGKELGLDGLRFYMLGRCGVLGDVEAKVVQSAMGYFEPSMVEKLWDSARARVQPREAGREYLACAQNFGATKFSGLEGLETYAEAAGKVIAAQDPAALALFSGIAAEPPASDPAALAMQMTSVLREMRGSVHLTALAACGLSPEIAHRVCRPDAIAMFGWQEGVEVTEDHQTRWQAAETLTDEMLVPAWSSIPEADAKAIVETTSAMQAVLDK